MISTHQHSFDFHKDSPRVLTVKALRSHPHYGKDVPEELNLKLLGDSQIMRDLKRSIQIVATSSETVLITGESGTGKELIARAIHDLSARRDLPYLAVNCGAFTESLLESELFGHVKGAFIGATTIKKGFFEAANHGTLFLDEFAEMSLTTQQRLLRVLQERKVRPVGSTDSREIELDVRIIVATNHDLKHDIAQGTFRNDLYYRVNVLQIHSPALRDRRNDVMSLATHFIRQYNERNSAKVSEEISLEVLASLDAYGWPGNVRELENIIKRLCLSAASEGEITPAHVEGIREFSGFLDNVTTEPVSFDLVSRNLNCLSSTRALAHHCRCTRELDQYEQLISELHGNLAAAARRLKIPRTTLRNRMILLKRKCKAG